MTLKRSSIVLLFFAVFMAAGLTACGKKGPPSVPVAEQIVLPAPGDLIVAVDKDQAVLTWTFDHSKRPESVELSGFDIFISEQAIDTCKGCPIVFEKTDTVGSSQTIYRTRLKFGFRYHFKVQATGEPDMKSEFSNIVRVECQ